MVSVQKVQTLIGMILLIGTLVSSLLVMIGGTWYLMQNGSDLLPNELLHQTKHSVTIREVWQFAFSFTPLGIVQLGLLLLIATQSLRVLLLCGFYAINHDYAFASISLFILCVLVYSSFWRH